jgi:hypothetical protein
MTVCYGIGFTMAKSGHTPDCVHCRFMVRMPSGVYRCRQHDLILHTPVSIFCKNLTPMAENDDEAYLAWFDSAVDTSELEANTLYTWVTTNTRSTQNEIEVQVDKEIVGTLTTYSNWSAGAFWRVLREVRQERREYYRKHGYTVTE